MKKYFIIIVCLFLLYPINIWAYDEGVTHRNITLQAATDPEKGIDNYLRQNLGFENGLETRLPSNDIKTVLYWLTQGSFDEDHPICRASSHFHNPLKPWDQSYMSDDPFYIDAWCSGTEFSTRYSNVTWGTGYLSRAGSPIIRPNQDMGWDNAREYYYWALTSISNSGQELYFTKAFRALGHVLHLLQDVSVPAHVRNDFTSHLAFNGFSSVEPTSWFGNRFEHYLVNNNSLIFGATPNFPSFSNPLVTDFWDTEQYTGDNPSESQFLGLAEFTNANYFSDETIPNNNPTPQHVFTHPIVNSTNTQICEDYAQNSTEIRKYASRKNRGDCPPLSTQRLADHFAAVSLINEEAMVKDENIPSLKLWLDENVHYTYAKGLLPRVVGYSAGLLDYFFRGQLQVTTIPILYKNNITYLRVRIKNITPTQETMMNGHFALAYRYTPTGGSPDGSNDIFDQGWASSSSPTAPCPLLPYAKREPGKEDEDPEMIIDFWLPTPIPREDYDSAKFTLAFKGTLGNEMGAVIGKALTLGEIKFEEEWNNGLTGNHTWAHTGLNYSNDNPDNGMTSNRIEGDCLIKDNIRFAAYTGYRCNESFVGHDYVLDNDQFIDILPILVTPDTYIQFKIDEMWINQRTPAPPGYINDWQNLVFRFNNNLFIQYSVGQGINFGSTTASYDFDPNLIIVDNIYELFKKAGITIPAGDLYLKNIDFTQQLKYNGASEIEYQQHMKIDSIRIVEGKKQ